MRAVQDAGEWQIRSRPRGLLGRQVCDQRVTAREICRHAGEALASLG